MDSNGRTLREDGAGEGETERVSRGVTNGDSLMSEHDNRDQEDQIDEEQLRSVYYVNSSPTVLLETTKKKNEFFAGALEEDAGQVLFGLSLSGYTVWMKLLIICAAIFVPYGFALYCHVRNSRLSLIFILILAFSSPSCRSISLD